VTQARFMINVSRYEERAKRVRERPCHPLDLHLLLLCRVLHHSVAIGGREKTSMTTLEISHPLPSLLVPSSPLCTMPAKPKPLSLTKVITASIRENSMPRRLEGNDESVVEVEALQLDEDVEMGSVHGISSVISV
jgi:hypothetical protein